MTVIAQTFNDEIEVLKQTNNFDFIECSFSALYKLSQQAEQYYPTDQACCLLKVRLFVELWCHEVASQLFITHPKNSDLFTKISGVSAHKKIPHYISDVLNQLRVEGNRQVHIVQDMYGQWKSDHWLSSLKMKQIMQGVHELAYFLEYSMKGKSYEHFVEWKEPQRSQMSEYVYEAMSGNAEATFKIAKHYSVLLEQLENQLHTREDQYLLQRDLGYWLRKADDQQHPETWLLYATSYANKHLVVPSNCSVNDYFLKAIECDSDGEAEYQFGLYLDRKNEQKRAIGYIEAAAAKRHHQALRKLQEHYWHKDNDKYEFYVSSGVEAKESRSFLLMAFVEIDKWLKYPEDELQARKSRSALLCSLHRNVVGSGFLLGYCHVFGYLGYKQDQSMGLKMMAEHHGNVSIFIQSTKLAFDAFSLDADYATKAIKVAPLALKYLPEEQKPTLKFDLAMLALEEMRAGKTVKIPFDVKSLIRESAEEGHVPAMEFTSSKEGKALLEDTSIRMKRRTNKVVDRSKQKKAKKQARKAKRNK
jgi:hypothetical protein